MRTSCRLLPYLLYLCAGYIRQCRPSEPFLQVCKSLYFPFPNISLGKPKIAWGYDMALPALDLGGSSGLYAVISNRICNTVCKRRDLTGSWGFFMDPLPDLPLAGVQAIKFLGWAVSNSPAPDFDTNFAKIQLATIAIRAGRCPPRLVVSACAEN